MKIKNILALLISLTSIASALKSNAQQCSTQGCSAKVQSVSSKQKSVARHSEPLDALGADDLNKVGRVL